MTAQRLRVFHTILAVAMGGTLLVFLMTPARDWKSVEPPDELAPLGEYIATHPADAKAAAKITDNALDYRIEKRRELWHAAHELTEYLEPYRDTAAISFARSGIFHWSELSEAERKQVVASIGPLLSDPNRFNALHRPIWALTRDLALLRSYAPQTEKALQQLVELAVINGRFDDYRRLREDVRRVRDEAAAAERASLTPPQLLQMLHPPFRVTDEPLIIEVLKELQRRPIDEDPQAPSLNALIDFIIDHHLGPLEGLEAITRMQGSASVAHRARLALALELPDRAGDLEIGNSDSSPAWRRYYNERADFETRRGETDRAEMYRSKAFVAASRDAGWTGLCETDLCGSAYADVDGPRVITAETVQTDDVPPWVELYVDDALVAEGALTPRRIFTIPKGHHRVELRLANPTTRNQFRRRVRLV